MNWSILNPPNVETQLNIVMHMETSLLQIKQECNLYS